MFLVTMKTNINELYGDMKWLALHGEGGNDGTATVDFPQTLLYK